MLEIFLENDVRCNKNFEVYPITAASVSNGTSSLYSEIDVWMAGKIVWSFIKHAVLDLIWNIIFIVKKR